MKRIFIILFIIFSLYLVVGCNNREGNNKTELEKVTDNQKETSLDTKQNEEKILYTNIEYEFTLELPLWWEGQYNIEDGTWVDETSKSISFNYNNRNFPGNIFTIIIQDEAIMEEDFDDPFLTYITEYDGKTFVYLSAMEPNEDLLKEENKEHLDIITKMVEEVPKIIESFNIEK